MADLVPRAMAALGRGSIMLGSTAGGIGGPSLGFLMAVPLVIASCAAGLLYGAQPAYPWFASSVALLLCTLVTMSFVRDPKTAEV